MQIPINVISDDALSFQADVLVLKYAQASYGVDHAVTKRLSKLHAKLGSSLPEFGKFLKIDTFGVLGAKEVLYVGVEALPEFRLPMLAVKQVLMNPGMAGSFCLSMKEAGIRLGRVLRHSQRGSICPMH